jgi:hypothetical protein
MRINTKTEQLKTHEGGTAKHINPTLQLRRSVMACMLWEDSFYESGQTIADRIKDLVPQCTPQTVAAMAIEARESMKLRHVPLLMVRELARSRCISLVSKTLTEVIQRPDELAEFLAIYWKDGKCPLSAQVKKGLAGAFNKFNEYSLAKYNRDGKIKLRDVLFLCHAKPKDKETEVLFRKVVNNTLRIPDTWEVELSKGGENKKTSWARLIEEKKLGSLALLRNLRNMIQAGVEDEMICTAIGEMRTERVLPFRFIAAARYAPRFEPLLEIAMFKCLQGHEKMPGKTVLLVDVSGSMETEISGKSDISRIDAACGLAMLAREICEDCQVYTFSSNLVQVPPRRGFALRDSIANSQPHSATYLGQALGQLMLSEQRPDRLIVITDEQAHDNVPDIVGVKSYLINVAAYKNGVGYGAWTHIDGWSEAVLDFAIQLEK